MKNLTKWIAFLQSITLMSAFSLSVFAADENASSGSLNDGEQTWEYSDGVLHFSGTGDLKILSERPFDETTLPWYEYRNEITTIIFDNGITDTGYFVYGETILYPNLSEIYVGESMGTGYQTECEILLFLRNKRDVKFYAPKCSKFDYIVHSRDFEDCFTPLEYADEPYVKLSGLCGEVNSDEKTASYECDEENGILHIMGTGTSVDVCDAETTIGRYDTIMIDRGINSIFGGVYTLLGNSTNEKLYYYPEYDDPSRRSDIKSLQERFGTNLKLINMDSGLIDDNNTVDITDATMMLQHYADVSSGLESGLNESQIYNADTDRDGQVSISDATNILTYYAQTAAGLSPDWADIINS